MLGKCENSRAGLSRKEHSVADFTPGPFPPAFISNHQHLGCRCWASLYEETSSLQSRWCNTAHSVKLLHPRLSEFNGSIWVCYVLLMFSYSPAACYLHVFNSSSLPERSVRGCNLLLTADYWSVSRAQAHWPDQERKAGRLRSRYLNKLQ